MYGYFSMGRGYRLSPRADSSPLRLRTRLVALSVPFVPFVPPSPRRLVGWSAGRLGQAGSAEVHSLVARYREEFRGSTVIVGVDTVDSVKGLVRNRVIAGLHSVNGCCDVSRQPPAASCQPAGC